MREGKLSLRRKFSRIYYTPVLHSRKGIFAFCKQKVYTVLTKVTVQCCNMDKTDKKRYAKCKYLSIFDMEIVFTTL